MPAPLASAEAVATIAVKDSKAASAFYEGKLGLEPQPSREPSVLTYKCGGASLLVYESEFAGTNKATSVTLPVDDVKAAVDALKAKGVAFEHFDDLPGVTREGDIHKGGKTQVAWFKDPDGNTLSIVNR